jgi:hypothetical protein
MMFWMSESGLPWRLSNLDAAFLWAQRALELSDARNYFCYLVETAFKQKHYLNGAKEHPTTLWIFDVSIPVLAKE